MRTRKKQRLPGYDYRSKGAYFITITLDSVHIKFGKIVKNEFTPNEYGKIVKKCWLDIPLHYTNVKLDEYVIMPDHFHGIIHITGDVHVRNGSKPFPTNNKIHGLSELIRAFKTFSSRKINDMLPKRSFKWHKSFNDRIVRKFNNEIDDFRFYIRNNPKISPSENH